MAKELTLPPGQGPFPAIVGLHPASDGSRDHFLFLHLAKVLPPRGMAVLRFDRRGDNVPLEVQVTDTEEVVRDLRSRSEIDPDRIGLWGFSQGAWVAPMVAARDARIAFLILVASTGVSPARQMLYGTAKHARMAGAGDAAAERIIATRKTVDDYRRGRATVDEAQRAIDGIKNEPWFAHAYLPSDASQLGPWPDMDFDPEAMFAKVRAPTLLFYGEDDEWQPVDESVAAWRRATAKARNPDVTVVRLSGTGHSPTVNGREDVSAVLPEYEDRMLAFLARLAPARRAGR